MIAEDWRYSNLTRIQGYLSEALKETAGSTSFDSPEIDAMRKIGRVVIFGPGKIESDVSYEKNKPDNILEDHPVLDFNKSSATSQYEFVFDTPDTEPVFFVYVGTHSAAYQVNVHVKTQAQVIEVFLTNSEEVQFTSVLSSFTLAANANLRHAVIANVKQKSRISHFLNIVQHQNSKSELFNLSLGGEWSRFDLRNFLRDPGASTSLGGLYLKAQNEFVDHCTKVFHEAPGTFSNQLYKGVLGGSSRAIFNGVIKIEEKCPEAKTNQLNKNLLVSKKAEIISRPQLEILTDNVKANHGMTIGNLSPSEIFYLMSRGLPEKVAHDMLADAFVHEVTDQFVDMAILPMVKSFISSSWEPLREAVR